MFLQAFQPLIHFFQRPVAGFKIPQHDFHFMFGLLCRVELLLGTQSSA